MKYYKKDGDVFAFSEDQLWLVDTQMLEMEGEELDRHVNPEKYLSAEERKALRIAQMPTLSKRQFSLLMFDKGLTESIAVLFLNNPRAKIEFDNTDKIERNSPTVQAMIYALKWTDEQADSLWVEALAL